MTVLAVGAHLDDIELGCGGTLARLAQEGVEVHTLVMTMSQYTRLDGSVRRNAREEGIAAAKILGIREPVVLPFPDSDLLDGKSQVMKIEAMIHEVGADTVFAMFPDSTVSDHRNAGLATLSAARRVLNVLLWEPFVPDHATHPFNAQVYYDISFELQKKMDAINAHKEEAEKFGPQWAEAIGHRARFRGYEVGMEAAEAFQVHRMVR